MQSREVQGIMAAFAEANAVAQEAEEEARDTKRLMQVRELSCLSTKAPHHSVLTLKSHFNNISFQPDLPQPSS
jgi:hypothetical protein